MKSGFRGREYPLMSREASLSIRQARFRREGDDRSLINKESRKGVPTRRCRGRAGHDHDPLWKREFVPKNQQESLQRLALLNNPSSSGVASATLTASGTTGAPYTVTASAAGLPSASLAA